MRKRERAVIFAGFGGQGLLFAGQVLAQAALDEGRGVLWIPSYGPEMRGGTASCTVVVADGPVGSPAVDRYAGAVVLNTPSAAKFAPQVAEGGILVVNAEAVEASAGREDTIEIRLPLATLAARAGSAQALSVVALGALCARLDLVSQSALATALREVVSAKHPEALAVDLVALDAGWAAATSASGTHLGADVSVRAAA